MTSFAFPFSFVTYSPLRASLRRFMFRLRDEGKVAGSEVRRTGGPPRPPNLGICCLRRRCAAPWVGLSSIRCEIDFFVGRGLASLGVRSESSRASQSRRRLGRSRVSRHFRGSVKMPLLTCSPWTGALSGWIGIRLGVAFFLRIVRVRGRVFSPPAWGPHTLRWSCLPSRNSSLEA